jgi:RNA-directed DNA polymerase
MTAPEAGAAPHDHDRPKRKQPPEVIVRRLQARIVKAQEAGRWNKVKVLQRMLAHSQSARVLAVERVTQNAGGKTPGVDGAT